MMISRRTRGPLAAFVDRLWVSAPPFPVQGAIRRERVLPTGAVHLAIRLADRPLRLFGSPEDTVGTAIGAAVVGGARTSVYIKDVSAPVPTVGALIRPGAVRLVMGVPGDELAGIHLSLDDLWGGQVAAWRDRLGDVVDPQARLDLWETLLATRLPCVRGIHPAIAEAILQLGRGVEVRTMVARTGYSHRHFIGLFRDAVGLAPKLYGRVVRFGRVLDDVAAGPERSWAELAADAGYADQSHFNRDFREFAGLSPEQYRQAAMAGTHHVPL